MQYLNSLVNRLKVIGVALEVGQVQKTVLSGTARTLKKVLEIHGCWLWLDLREFSSIVLLCVSSIIIIIIIIIIITKGFIPTFALANARLP